MTGIYVANVNENNEGTDSAILQHTLRKQSSSCTMLEFRASTWNDCLGRDMFLDVEQPLERRNLRLKRNSLEEGSRSEGEGRSSTWFNGLTAWMIAIVFHQWSDFRSRSI